MILENPHIYDKSTIAAIVYYYTVYIGGITQQEACSLCDITPRYYRELKARDEQALISFSDDMFMYDQNDVDSAMLTNACDAVYTALGIVTVGDEMYQMLKKHFAMKHKNEGVIPPEETKFLHDSLAVFDRFMEFNEGDNVTDQSIADTIKRLTPEQAEYIKNGK
jgi:benzoyl-CoA reductase/2-hydroxyglutaryl-CoA dehydratase subunit BcrC/BadD/HgdB